MKNLILLFVLVLASLASQAQTDSLATVHFYSFKPEQGAKKVFELLQNAESITTQEEGGEVMIKMPPGSYAFGLLPRSGTVSLTVLPGTIYYLLGKTNGVLTQRTQSGAEADLKIVRGN